MNRMPNPKDCDCGRKFTMTGCSHPVAGYAIDRDVHLHVDGIFPEQFRSYLKVTITLTGVFGDGRHLNEVHNYLKSTDCNTWGQETHTDEIRTVWNWIAGLPDYPNDYAVTEDTLTLNSTLRYLDGYPDVTHVSALFEMRETWAGMIDLVKACATNCSTTERTEGSEGEYIWAQFQFDPPDAYAYSWRSVSVYDPGEKYKVELFDLPITPDKVRKSCTILQAPCEGQLVVDVPEFGTYGIVNRGASC